MSVVDELRDWCVRTRRWTPVEQSRDPASGLACSSKRTGQRHHRTRPPGDVAFVTVRSGTPGSQTRQSTLPKQEAQLLQALDLAQIPTVTAHTLRGLRRQLKGAGDLDGSSTAPLPLISTPCARSACASPNHPSPTDGTIGALRLWSRGKHDILRAPAPRYLRRGCDVIATW